MKRFATLALLALAAPAAAQQPDAALVERARGIHERAITIDTHDDIPGNFGTEAMSPCVASDRRQVDLPKMKQGGLDVAFFIVYVGQGPRTAEGHQNALEQALQKFQGIHAAAEQQCPNEFAIAYRADDVQKILASGRKVIAIGIENGYQLANDPANVKRFYDLGGRYLSVTHIGHNDLGDSSNPRNEADSEHDGLSALGEQVIREMNRVGMMVDVSHIGKATMLDIARITRAPMIASHSAARSVNDNLRNLDDEQLDVLKRNGGVVQTVAFAAYVKNDAPEKTAALNAARQELGITGRNMTDEQRAAFARRRADIDAKWPPATVSDFVDHIDYMVKRIGTDHVGISSDFDGGGGVVGWNDASETFNVTLELVRRGYSEADIHKLWGGNLLRVWREVEKVAGR